MPALFGVLSAFTTKFWALLAGFFAWALPWGVEKVFKILGIGIASYIGLDIGMDQLEAYIFAQLDNVGSDIYAVLVLAGVADAIKIILTAASVTITFKLANGISLTKKTASA